jgi:hypothetical protein
MKSPCHGVPFPPSLMLCKVRERDLFSFSFIALQCTNFFRYHENDRLVQWQSACFRNKRLQVRVLRRLTFVSTRIFRLHLHTIMLLYLDVKLHFFRSYELYCSFLPGARYSFVVRHVVQLHL